MKDRIRETLAFQDLTPEEKEKRGILCRLYGPCADIKGPTRNGRKYTDSLWQEVFTKNELVRELLENGGIPGEAQHPEDRDEIDVEKIALMMPEAPKRDENGHLIAYFDVQDTPCGRILYQLAKYGFKLGISSRGTGDIIYNDDGEETVDPSTYDFKCFDAVIIPSVKDARLTMVESLQKDNPKLMKALTESLNNANKDDRKIMEETLNDLGINIDEKKSLNENINTSNSANIKVDSNKGETESNSAVKDNEAKQLVSSLQESLKSKVLLETKVQKLQEDLAVSDTKVKQLQEELNKYKGLVVNMTKYASENKDLKKDIVSLEEKLASQEKTITLQEKRIGTLVDKVHLKETKAKDLRENYNSTSNEVKSLQEKLASSEVAHKNEIKQLKEQLKETNANLEIKENELSTRLAKASKLIEKYKGFVNTTVDRYIESKAVMLGVTPNEIKNRLSESYTLDEVDKVCESLQDFNLRISKLPFNVEKGTRIGITESKKSRYEELSAEEDVSSLAKFIKEN